MTATDDMRAGGWLSGACVSHLPERIVTEGGETELAATNEEGNVRQLGCRTCRAVGGHRPGCIAVALDRLMAEARADHADGAPGLPAGFDRYALEGAMRWRPSPGT